MKMLKQTTNFSRPCPCPGWYFIKGTLWKWRQNIWSTNDIIHSFDPFSTKWRLLSVLHSWKATDLRLLVLSILTVCQVLMVSKTELKMKETGLYAVFTCFRCFSCVRGIFCWGLCFWDSYDTETCRSSSPLQKTNLWLIQQENNVNMSPTQNQQEEATYYALVSVAHISLLKSIRARSSPVLRCSDDVSCSRLGSAAASRTAFAPRLPIANFAVN